MTKKEYDRASKMLDELIASMAEAQLGPPERPDMAALLNMAVKLKKMIMPMPTPQEILMKVPGETATDRAREIGISRQGYYNLLSGTARPNLMMVKRLSELTGVRPETIRVVW
jgi:antitoxin component HigA of HigAB toxin-antitoxin module